MSSERDQRLEAELALLEAMYPGQTVYNARGREVRYHSEVGSFQLRLPDGYLHDELPEVLSASVGTDDLRQRMRLCMQDWNAGEEVLDSVVLAFVELSELSLKSHSPADESKADETKEGASKATVIVWLHHLLNTNKRKQALSPSSPAVSGVTKPGYPGVLVYSGLSEPVHEHVNELKKQNWQAFQVRLETDDEWLFSHGEGVKEVESMKEVVFEVGDGKKTEFLEAMRMK